MSPWLLDNLNRILVGLVGTGFLGAIGILIRLSVRQSVRLYQDDLIQCRSREDGHLETIQFQKERSDYREELLVELLAERTELRARERELESMIRQQTPLPRASESKPT